MNIYVVDAGPYTYTEVFDSELGGRECEDYAIRIVAANTRGQAKAVFLRYDKDYQRSFDFASPMRILKLDESGEIDKPHVLEYNETNDPYDSQYWDIAHKKLGR